MSYLMKFERRELRPANLTARKYAIRWRSVSGSVLVLPAYDAEHRELIAVTVHYWRHTKLGALLSANHESERHFIALEIRKDCALSERIHVNFVSV